MLVKIREKSKGIFAYILVGLIGLAFSMWGMDSIFTALRGDPNEVASINGQSISAVQVDRYAQQQLRQLVQSGQADPEDIDMNQLRQLALSQLIQEELLQQKAQTLNLHISDAWLDRQLVQFEAFHNDQGRFDRDIFVERLRQQGMAATDFRQQLREDLLNQQLLFGVSDSEFLLNQELSEFQRLAGQTRTYRYARFKPEDYLDQVQIDDAEVEAFYTAHSERFMSPERLRADYLIFDPENLKDNINLSEEELQAEYARFAAQAAESSRYFAAHILLTFSDAEEKQQARQRLEQLRQQIQAGETSFAQSAQEISEDTATARQGGQLGAIEPGTLDSDFEQTLFSLEQEGDLAIAETDFGLHLIQLTQKEEAQVPELAEVRAELRDRLLAQPLRAATSDFLEQLRNLSFSSETLTQVAEAMALELQTSRWLKANQLEGFWAEDPVAEVLFSKDIIEEGWISEPLRLEDGRYLVIAAREYQPRQKQPLAEVAEQVRIELRLEQAQEKAKEAAEQQQAQLDDHKNPALDWTQVTEQTRNSRRVHPQINQAAFALAPEADDKTRLITLEQGPVILIELQKVTPGQVSENEQEKEQLRQMLVQDRGYRLQSQLVNHLERQAEIEMQ